MFKLNTFTTFVIHTKLQKSKCLYYITDALRLYCILCSRKCLHHSTEILVHIQYMCNIKGLLYSRNPGSCTCTTAKCLHHCRNSLVYKICYNLYPISGVHIVTVAGLIHKWPSSHVGSMVHSLKDYFNWFDATRTTPVPLCCIYAV